MRLLDLALTTTWAIYPPALEAMIRLLEGYSPTPRELAEAFHFSESARSRAIDAVSAGTSRPVEDATSLTRRGSVGILSIQGPITRYSTFFNSSFGSGQSVESLARDLSIALEDPTIASILLNVDSPGGEVNGIAELSSMLYDARATKPIRAYVSDGGASAAYWLASSASSVTVAETAFLGSIGVVAAVQDPSRSKDIEIVSSVSPNKRPDVRTERGRAQYQSMVDALANVFVSAVSRNRDVDQAVVLQDFGAGGLLIGREAVDAGMADEVGSFEGLVQQMQADSDAELAPLNRPARRAADVSFKDRILSLIAATPEPSSPDGSEVRGTSDPGLTTVGGSFTDSLSGYLESRTGYVNPLDGSTSWVPTVSTSTSTNDPMIVAPPSPDPPANTAEEARPVENTHTSTPPPAESEELVRLRAENRRLLLERIESQATAFAALRVSEQRAFPGEEQAITSAYVQAALDDHHLGTDANQPTRVQLLANLFAARVPISALTADHLGSAVASVIQHRATTPSDPDAVTEERRAYLNSLSPLGRASTNGTRS